MYETEMVNVRYMVDDVDASIVFYCERLGFEVRTSAAPAFADVQRGNLRLLLSGPLSSAGRPMPDGQTPTAGGWNRIHFIVDDIEADVERLRGRGAPFRNDIVTGPGGKQILLEDPSGNVVELFEPAARERGSSGSKAPMNEATVEPSRLARRLTLSDAVVIGLGSMIGAGVFTAVGPAARAAGGGLLLAVLGIAAVVAYCNATSSARLAIVHPSSGGTYVYGRAQLGPVWGYLAGWGFVVGKTASCAAMALSFGAYAAPGSSRAIAVVAVVALTAVNYFGIRKTAALTLVIVVVVLTTLAAVVVGSLFGGVASTDNVGPLTAGGWSGTLQAAGLLFFAFAGYARVATLGEEVVDPVRTIPKAIRIALATTLVVYAGVLASVLVAVGPDVLAGSSAPLATAVRAGSMDWLVPVVRVGGAVAALGVLLSLIVGVSRTTFAMAANADLPGWLAAVHPARQVPHRVELAVGALVVVIVCFVDLRGAIGFSSFTVLTYYAIANASAWTLTTGHRGRTRATAALGLFGCVLLAFTLPSVSIVVGTCVLVAGLAFRHLTRLAASGSRA